MNIISFLYTYAERTQRSGPAILMVERLGWHGISV